MLFAALLLFIWVILIVFGATDVIHLLRFPAFNKFPQQIQDTNGC